MKVASLDFHRKRPRRVGALREAEPPSRPSKGGEEARRAGALREAEPPLNGREYGSFANLGR